MCQLQREVAQAVVACEEPAVALFDARVGGAGDVGAGTGVGFVHGVVF